MIKILMQIFSFVFNLIVLVSKLDDSDNFWLLLWTSIVVFVLYVAIYKIVQKKDLEIVHKFKVLPVSYSEKGQFIFKKFLTFLNFTQTLISILFLYGVLNYFQISIVEKEIFFLFIEVYVLFSSLLFSIDLCIVLFLWGIQPKLWKSWCKRIIYVFLVVIMLYLLLHVLSNVDYIDFYFCMLISQVFLWLFSDDRDLLFDKQRELLEKKSQALIRLFIQIGVLSCFSMIFIEKNHEKFLLSIVNSLGRNTEQSQWRLIIISLFFFFYTILFIIDIKRSENSDKKLVPDIRIHFKELPSVNLKEIGLWSWDDVEVPSFNKGSWPRGATSFTLAGLDDYGYYMDIRPKQEQARKISLLINNKNGENLTVDKTVELISSDMHHVWFDKNFKLCLYKPLQEGYLRINYFRTDGNYNQKSLWLWGDVADVRMGDWPHGVDFEHRGQYGVYRDVKLTELANLVGFLLLDESQSGDAVKIQPYDYNFSDLKNHTQIFLRDDDATIYTNPYYINDVER